MSLSLDARQRAMLREMGITVWSPVPEAAQSQAPVSASASASAMAQAPSVIAVTAPAVQIPPPLPPSPPPARPTHPVPGPSVAAAPRSEASMAMALTVHAPQPLYPDVDPRHTPAGLGQGWLIVTDSVPAQDPLASDAGRLLDNLLRAMQLHKHPQVDLVVLTRGLAPNGQGEPGAVAHQLDQLARTLRPSMVLLLGHVAARAALGGNEPLGRLRAVPHRLGDSPALVSYDPAFLLRSQGNKAAAWSDCCQALARVRQAQQG